MRVRRRLVGAAASAVGVAAAGVVIQLVRRRRRVGRRSVDDVALGTLHSPPRTVIASDGVPLHVEVDEAETPDDDLGGVPLTVVFCHGYTLTSDSWHFQRAAYRGLVRTVFYDQRSHGRSGRSSLGQATIEQLGRDLKQVLDVVVPDGPVVLVGHSMGGMTIVALAEEHPELFGDRVVGVGLVSTTAGGLDPAKLLMPLVPAKIGGPLANSTVRSLARGHRAVDGVRRMGKAFATVATDVFAFGEGVPASYVEFVDQMIAATPFEVVAEFFPNFGGLDKLDSVEVMSKVPTEIVCGTKDRLTAIGHSRRLHSLIAGSTLTEVEGAGHMVMLERHREVNEVLDRLLLAAADLVRGAQP